MSYLKNNILPWNQIMPGRRAMFQELNASILHEILGLKEWTEVFIPQKFSSLDYQTQLHIVHLLNLI